MLKTNKNKIGDNDAMITKADEDNTVVIIQNQNYSQKANDVFTVSNTRKINFDFTKKFVKELNLPINKCTSL